MAGSKHYTSPTNTYCAVQRIFVLMLMFAFFGFNAGAQAHLIVGESIYEADPQGNPDVKIDRTSVKNLQKTSRSVIAGPILYDQSEMINYSGQGFGGADVSGSTGMLLGVANNIASNFIIADEFVVPPGELWIIDSIVVFHYQAQTMASTVSSINDIRLQLRQGSVPGMGTIVFGDLTTNRLANSSFSTIYRTRSNDLTNNLRPIMRSAVNLSDLPLTSGTYIIEYLAGGTLTNGPFALLRTLGTTHIATGNGFQFNVTWNNLQELDATGNNPLPKGTSFIVYGTNCIPPEATFSATASTCNNVTANNNGIISLVSQSNASHFGVSSPGAMAYDGPVTIGSASPMPANGSVVAAGISHGGANYIIRVFNADDACFIDVPVTVPPGPDCALNGIFDLALQKTITSLPVPASAGGLITYSLTVFNQGDFAATNVSLTDFFPIGLTLADTDWTAAGNTASLNQPINNIPPGGQASVDITFMINNMASGTLVNNAEISGASGGTDNDSSPGNGAAASSEDDFGSAEIEICLLPTLMVRNDTVCRGSSFDLSTLVVTHSGDELTYYTSLNDATISSNPLVSPNVVVNTATNYYIKSTYEPESPGCETIKEITVFLKSARCAGISVMGPR